MSDKKKILIVDDDENIAELISLYLVKECFDTVKVTSGEDAFEMFSSEPFDLVILDIMLPGMDGYQVCSKLRSVSTVPIILLSAKGETFDKVLGLDMGADDYIMKPFEAKEMVARVKALLRRFERCEKTPEKTSDDFTVRCRDLEINISNYTVVFNGKKVEMTPKEIELLHFLASHPARVFTREQLLEELWGYDYIGDTRTVDVHIKRIREKIVGAKDWEIATVWGVGYKFEVKDEA